MPTVSKATAKAGNKPAETTKASVIQAPSNAASKVPSKDASASTTSKPSNNLAEDETPAPTITPKDTPAKTTSKADTASPKPNKKDKKDATSKGTKAAKKPNKKEKVVEDVSNESESENEQDVPKQVETTEDTHQDSSDDEEYSLVSNFNPVFWDGIIPKPKSLVALQASKTPREEQVRQCEEIIELFNDEEAPALETLNQAMSIIPFLLPLPSRNRACRVVYGIGSGSGLTGLIANDLGDDVLVLYGEIEPQAATPFTMQLPEDALYPKRVKVPTMKQFQFQRNKNNQKPFWFKAMEIRKNSFIPNLIPVPAFLVYDAFDIDIDSIIVLERWLNLREHINGTFRVFDALLSVFARATTVNPTVTLPQGKLGQDIFVSSLPKLVLTWKKRRLHQLFPEHFTLPSSNSNKKQKAEPSKKEEPAARSYMEEFAKTFIEMSKQTSQSNLATNSSNATNTTALATATKESENDLNMSASGHARLLTQCGLSAGEEDAIPVLWKLLAEKNASSADKKAAVRLQLSQPENQLYKEAKLRVLSSIVNMIIKRDFEEEMGLSSLAAATKGLTPYCVPDLNESDLERLNEATQALDLATTTTVKDMTAIHRVAQTPPLPSKPCCNN